MSEQISQLNYLKIAPRKVRLVADLIKNLSVNEAEAQLLMERRRAAKSLLKLLRSAVSNATNNQHLNVEKLFIKSIRVDQGPMLKRYLPRARGMATPIQKKMSHVILILGEKENQKVSRFKIEIKKKVKLPSGETKKTKKVSPKGEGEEVKTRGQKRNPGFFKKVFNRKAEAGN